MSSKKRKIGNFQKCCKYTIDGTVSQDTQSIRYVLYNIKTRRDYKKCSLFRLISNNYLTDKSAYVCSFCLNNTEKLQKKTLLETGTEDSILEDPVLE